MTTLGVSGIAFVSTLRRAEDDVTFDCPGSWGPLPSPNPALGLAVVTCMDVRLDLTGVLGIGPGDAHILRNAGGRITPDVIRSLHLSVNLMKVREVGIIHHTGCGLEGVDNDTLTSRIGVSGIDFLPFQSVHDSLAEDVDAVARANVLPADGIVWGAVYRLEAHRASVVHGPVVRETTAG